MNLLLSNDDGVFSPGLSILAEALQSIGEIRVIAPDRDRSGASNSLTLNRPLRPTTLANGFIGVDGTPTDCVYLGMSGLLDIKPDMVVSGINTGANLGDDVLYSGTVAAAMEGRFLGLPALAISLNGRKFQNFTTATMVAKRFVEEWKKLELKPRALLNVNVPDVPENELKGIKLTRLGHRVRANELQKFKDPRGITRYWIAAAGEGEDIGPDTDFHAIKEGFVSVTPLQVDMTGYDSFDNLSAWLKQI